MIWKTKRKVAILVALCVVARVTAEATQNSSSPNDIPAKNDDDDEIIQVNPDYVEADAEKAEEDVQDNDSGGGNSDHSDVEDLKDNYSAKTALSEALGASKGTTKRPIELIKKHYLKVVTLVALYFFRDTISSAVFDYFFRTTRNPGSKETVYVFRSSSLIKALFCAVALYRAIYSHQKGEDFMSSLAKIHPSVRLFAPLVPGFLPPPNPAFVPSVKQNYAFERINERYVKDSMALQKSLSLNQDRFSWPLPTGEIRYYMPKQVTNLTATKGDADDAVIILDLTNLDTSVSIIDDLRDQVSFLLSHHRETAMKVSSAISNKGQVPLKAPKLEVVAIIESPGGGASEYGCAAQQLLRLRNEPGIELTVCVDTVAASGGYMLACTASPGRLIAAPFSVIGSIGVIGQVVNAHKALVGWGITPVVLRGGKDKAPLGLLGEVTKEGKDRTQIMIDKVHRAFMRHVVEARPILKDTINEIGTGDTWLGYDAIENGLADELSTSDDYIARRIKEGARVVKMKKCQYKSGFWGKQILTESVETPIRRSLRTMVSRTVGYLSQLGLIATDVEQPQIRIAPSLQPMAKY